MTECSAATSGRRIGLDETFDHVARGSEIVTILDEFIAAERWLYNGDDVNRFAFALAQPARYLQFLEFIIPRHAELCVEQMAATRKLMDEPRGKRELTPEELEEMRRQGERQQRIIMDHESFVRM